MKEGTAWDQLVQSRDSAALIHSIRSAAGDESGLDPVGWGSPRSRRWRSSSGLIPRRSLSRSRPSAQIVASGQATGPGRQRVRLAALRALDSPVASRRPGHKRWAFLLLRFPARTFQEP